MTSAVLATQSSLSHQETTGAPRTLYSNTLVTLIVLICVLFLSAYLCALIVMYRYARNHPRALNKKSGVYLQRYAPAFYLFLVISSLFESSLSGWLLVQDAYLENFPNSQSRRSAALLLLVAFATRDHVYLLSEMFPTDFAHAGHRLLVAHTALWLLVTLILWTVGAGVLNAALPQLLLRAQCGSLAYCRQIQGLFAVAVLTTLALTGGLFVLIWAAKSFTFCIPVLRRKSEA
ncbi:hypothetical protein H2248_008165 [Termitomyces sp. 'cryptogamus']|nr:hypothetical protein H2248_008165 [Termitomyces sp. 'cryptogamus']